MLDLFTTQNSGSSRFDYLNNSSLFYFRNFLITVWFFLTWSWSPYFNISNSIAPIFCILATASSPLIIFIWYFTLNVDSVMGLKTFHLDNSSYQKPALQQYLNKQVTDVKKTFCCCIRSYMLLINCPRLLLIDQDF